MNQEKLLAARGQLIELSRHSLLFELFLPQDWHPSGTYPVLTFLHGRGESGGFDVTNSQSLPLQLRTNRSAAAASPFITIIPQCPAQCMHFNGWMPPVLQSISALLHEWVVPALGGDMTRQYLAGQSMGGHGAWTYAAQQPRLFAALVVVCGYAQGGEEAAAMASRLARQRLPVAIYHSADDSVIPVAAADQMASALRTSGYQADGAPLGVASARDAPGGASERHTPRLKYIRYENAPGPPMPEFAHLIGHGSYELAFRDAALYEWLLRQQCARCSRPMPPWTALVTPEEARA
eukprot:CAMPEP_0115833518 /NCGR_PEP_ID=MMETSP0287-20121206/3214_1 /TAXON_ID=412157 /ORGANISM="Chrysochromulina rotalis, Strain UIO044" /LENGTH=292 /DNA_ID=CAMNT_0003286935 /DNA_START=1 /DNA_END=879 /DNA_ORIENTATION=+